MWSQHVVVIVVDYKTSNLGSIKRALELSACEVIISDDPSDLKKADKIILPGIGVFADAMTYLTRLGWVDALHEEVVHNQKYFLGICLGMQLLADTGYEGGQCPGLNFIPGSVQKIEQTALRERIPHVGWNEVYSTQNSPLFSNIASGADFYFVHSYSFVPKSTNHVIATTPYGNEIVAAVQADNIFGVQFHPEKSAPLGFDIFKNFLTL